MSKFRSARAVLAGAAVVALAGCSASASSSSGSSVPMSTDTSSSTASAKPVHTPNANSNAYVPTGSISFPAAVGDTWIYQQTAGVNGSRVLQTSRVLSATSTNGARRVVMSVTADADGKRTTTEQTLIFYANGSIGYPEAGGDVAVLGTGVLWPSAAGLESGRAYRSVLPVKINKGSASDANVTVQGSGTHPVTVPAGTYQATLVTTTVVIKVGDFATTEEIQTWVAPGTGTVKSEVSLLTNGHSKTATTQELVSFTKG